MAFVLQLNVKRNVCECLYGMKTAGNGITKTSESPVGLDQRKEVKPNAMPAYIFTWSVFESCAPVLSDW